MSETSQTDASTTTSIIAEDSSSDECPQLTAEEIERITGTAVVAVPRGENAAAGGECGNYVTAEGDGLVGVNVVDGAESYLASFPPEGAYLPGEPLAGIGDEAMGFRLLAGYPFSYVVARKGEAVVVVFSLSQDISDEQMQEMAISALG